MKNKVNFLSLLVATVLLTACNSDSAIKTSDLKGTWVCVDGTVNGEKAELMIRDKEKQNTGATIEMTESILKFDLLTELQKKNEHNYKIEGNKLKSAVDPELVFTINKIDGKKMNISFSADKMNFDLVMEKQ